MASFDLDALPAIELGAHNLQLWNTVVQEIIDEGIIVVCVPDTHTCLNPVAFQALYQGDSQNQQLVVFDLEIAETLAEIIQEDPDWDKKVCMGRCGACAQIFTDVPLNPWLHYSSYL